MPSTRNDSPSKINISRQCSFTYKPGKIERSCHLFRRQIQDKFTWSVNIEHVNTEHFKTKTTYPTYQLRSQKKDTIVMVRQKPCKPYTDHLCTTHVLSRISYNLVWNIFKPNASCRQVTKTQSRSSRNDHTAHPKKQQIMARVEPIQQLTVTVTTHELTTGESSILRHLLQKVHYGFSIT